MSGLLKGLEVARSDIPFSMARGSRPREFILQGFDSVTETISVEWRVQIVNIDRLRDLLGPDCDKDRDLKGTYYGISKRDMRRIGKLCHPPIVPDSIYTAIGRRSPLYDNVPYMIHTDFELPLMLEGRKPLAVFSDGYPSEWFDDYLAPFEQFVAAGRIIRRIVDTPMPHLKARRPDLDGTRAVYFTLPGDEWRTDAYMMLMDVGEHSGWNDSLERFQGSLLGYEDWQNDWWIEHRLKKRESL